MRLTFSAALTATSLIALTGCAGDDASGVPPDAGVTLDSGNGADAGDPDALVRYTQRQEPCDERHPLRRAYFGDFHVHTSYSFDAYAHETRNDPFDAYAFARGATVRIGRLNEDGQGSIGLALREPLDFAAVTDHSEYLGETVHCTDDPDAPGYDSEPCRKMREDGSAAVAAFAVALAEPIPVRFQRVCGVGGERCRDAAVGPWEDIKRAAAMYNDAESSCEFAAFVGYEWTGSPRTATLHRNVIFRNDDVLATPISYFDETEPESLRQALDTQCTEGGSDGRCEVLTIPHNSNASRGNAFKVDFGIGMTQQEKVEAAERRARLEPLMEITQHKGVSECYYKQDQPVRRFSEDPVCEYELLGDFSFENPVIPFPTRRDYLRGALKLGLRTWQDIGANPLRLGVIGSTDTHNGTPGATDERDFRGHLGATEQDEADLGVTADGVNPGGLVGVWAVERSRDAIFEALSRRETFGTSGTRIRPRFFGGWSYSTSACVDQSSDALLAAAYASGVPMGGTLPAPPEAGAAPTFLVQAARHEAPLAVTQVVKVWIDAAGEARERVYDVQGAVDNGASLDVDTCEYDAQLGLADACSTWTDPDFDPALPAVYYMRVLEVPTCRFNRWRCLAQERDGEPMPADCFDEDVKQRSAQQERAWTSPIWYEPSPG